MPRNKRKKLKFNEDSLNELVQECYNDACSLRAEVITLLNKWKINAKDPSQMAMLGKEIVSLLSAQEKTLDKKLMITKIIKEIVFKDKGEKNKESSDESLTEKDMYDLQKIMQDLQDKEKSRNLKR